MEHQRIQKVIAATGFCSRRKAEELLLQQRVLLNGLIAKVGSLVDPKKDNILVDGNELPHKPKPRVIILNKPAGLISSCQNQYGRRSVLTLLPSYLRQGLHPVGRLDIESRGALLLTNQGELTLRLTHPRYEHTKTYLVWINGQLSIENIQKWRSGLLLDGQLTMKAKVKIVRSTLDRSLLEIELREGRNRQIRRTAKLLGHHVLDLQRVNISGISLGDLNEGCWRELHEHEWKYLLRSDKPISL